MTNLFVVYVAAFLLPLLFHSWRVAVIGLGIQGFLLGLISLTTHETSLTTIMEAGYLFLIRAFVVPWILFRSVGTYEIEPRFTLIKTTIGQWLVVFAIIANGAIFGRTMSPDDMTEAFQVGTASIAILTSLLILANQHHAIGQIVGILTFEGGLTLVELLSPHAMPLPVYIGISTVFILLLLTLADYIRKLKSASPDEHFIDDRIVL